MKDIVKEQARIRALKDEMSAQIESLWAESRTWDEPIHDKKQQISDLRTKISALKGDSKAEDDQFHIDGSRDKQGNTFLMVATQNNDVKMVKICFQFQVKPNVTNPEGFTVMLLAYIFKLNDMAVLIAKHGGTHPTQQMEVRKGVVTTACKKSLENNVNWYTTLCIAEQVRLCIL